MNSALARQLLERLGRDALANEDLVLLSDRFPFYRNYVEKTQALVASHFDVSFQSCYGQYLVKIKDYRPSRLPELAEVKSIIVNDFRRLQVERRVQAERQYLVGQYNIVP
jgi:hypothetical protein